MELNPGAKAYGFTVVSHEGLPEIDGESVVAVHEKSGARLLFLKNDDNNKSFSIGFKTPPQDDTGVFHILEHSVLCGSRKYPVKEPFVDLLKSSMQTFLNAMTFADKTLYPVASTNEQDLFNLMDVYLDAVFHPRIYEKRQIFEQEGWHYELERPEGADGADGATLSYNGVVFNEMKGALSDANSVLYNALQAGLFPDNCYKYESGGVPESIPTLTYENFLDEHRRHYRTDNSYIILYGNLDIDRALSFLDERYLTPVADEQNSSEIDVLPPRSIKLQDGTCGQATIPMRTAPENECAGTAYAIGTSRDRVRVLAADILLDALLGSNEAPLKRRLLDLGLAHDIHAFVSDSVLQPFAVIQLQMPQEDGPLSHSVVIENEVKCLLSEGLDHALIEAAISHEEFQMREHDFGTADGVVYAMTALSGWLYDDDAATSYLRYEDAFAELRQKLDEGYFEELARALLCDAEIRFSARVVPNPNAHDGLSERLATAQDALTPEQAEQIDAEVALLRQLQEAPDSPEATATLPRLAVADIGEAPDEPPYTSVPDAPLACLRHSVPTRGIAYAYRYFDVNRLAFDDLPYVAILTMVLGKLDTARHTAAELDTLVQGKLGNLGFFVDVYEQRDDIEVTNPKFIVSASALSANASWLASLPREVLIETDYSDTGRILNILKQRKIALEQSFVNSGHSCAAARCKSYYAPVGVLREQISNVGFYQFLCKLIDEYEGRAGALAERLRDVAARLFCDNGCLISFAGDDADYARFWEGRPECGRDGSAEHALVVPAPVVRNEAFVVPSDVCFAALGYDRRLIGHEFTGSWAVAGRALSYDYLWNEVRVKGGAYGAGFQAMRTGNMRFYSYRDPHLDETLQRFGQAASWLASFEPSREELEGFIVASVASIDSPIKARELVGRQTGDYFCGRTVQDRREVRRQIIETDLDAVREFSGTVERLADAQAMCAFGNRAILESSTAGFTVVNLVG